MVEASGAKLGASVFAVVTAAELGRLMLSPSEPIILFLPLSFLLTAFFGTMCGIIIAPGDKAAAVVEPPVPEGSYWARWARGGTKVLIFGATILVFTSVAAALSLAVALSFDMLRVPALLLCYALGCMVRPLLPKLTGASDKLADFLIGRWIR